MSDCSVSVNNANGRATWANVLLITLMAAPDILFLAVITTLFERKLFEVSSTGAAM